MAILFAVSLIIFIFGCLILLMSHRDISNGVSVDTNKKIFKISRIVTLISGFLFVVLLCISLLNSSSSHRCNICGKPATNTFQGYGYCDEHYKEAIIWAFDNMS